MTTTTVYVIGTPGSGKTTALQRARELRRWEHLSDERLPVRHRQWLAEAGIVCELGRVRADGLAGTDVLQLDAQPLVIGWLVGSYPPRMLVGEGDRLATDGFFQAAAHVGPLDVLWIDTPPPVAQARAAARGAEQDPAWWQGRATKIERLVQRWGPHRIDGLQCPEAVAVEVAEWLP